MERTGRIRRRSSPWTKSEALDGRSNPLLSTPGTNLDELNLDAAVGQLEPVEVADKDLFGCQ